MADDEHRSDGVGAGDLARLIPVVVLVVALGAFAAANTEKTKIDYVFGDTSAPLILVLLATAVVGALIAGLLRFRNKHH